MIEVTFSDSACGGLTVAMGFGRGKYHEPAIAVFMPDDASEQQRAEAHAKALRDHRAQWENAVPIDGDPGSVYCFCLNPAYGDISGDLFDDRREAFLRSIFLPEPGIFHNDYAAATMERIRKERKKLLRRASEGEPIRVWYSSDPNEMCGFYHLMSILPIGTDILAVRLPEFTEQETTVTTHTGWGEIGPGEFGKYLQYQVKISENMHKMYRFLWNRLVEENAPVRAFVNGRLVSAGEGIYDHYILRELEKQEEVFHEARLIGSILGKYQLCIPDWFIHQRIRHMELEGMLEPADNDPGENPGYRRYLRKIHP